jgi:hypothetical protein
MQTVQHSKLPMSKETKGPAQWRIARYLDGLQARGDLVVSVDGWLNKTLTHPGADGRAS